MASYGYTFTSGDTVTPTKLNNARTVSDIVNADIKSDAAIAGSKLADDSITNAKINSSAAIAASKLADTLDLSIKTVTLPDAVTRNGSQIYSRNNVVGTVTQSGGVPTAAIVETGSNSNGRYTKWADGTMICTHYIESSAANPLTWTFPAAFAAGTQVVVQATLVSGAARFATVGAPYATGVDVYRWSTTGASTTFPLVAAFGRWF